MAAVLLVISAPWIPTFEDVSLLTIPAWATGASLHSCSVFAQRTTVCVLWCVTTSFGHFCHQVLSIEKADSTSALPNPVIVSIRTKKAFQLIELNDRDELVENMNSRLRALQWKRSMFRSRKEGKRSVVSGMFNWVGPAIYTDNEKWNSATKQQKQK